MKEGYIPKEKRKNMSVKIADSMDKAFKKFVKTYI